MIKWRQFISASVFRSVEWLHLCCRRNRSQSPFLDLCPTCLAPGFWVSGNRFVWKRMPALAMALQRVRKMAECQGISCVFLVFLLYECLLATRVPLPPAVTQVIEILFRLSSWHVQSELRNRLKRKHFAALKVSHQGKCIPGLLIKGKLCLRFSPAESDLRR